MLLIISGAYSLRKKRHENKNYVKIEIGETKLMFSFISIILILTML